MKGGHTPIHIQRWAPADYQADEHVSLLLKRRAWATLTFYRQFIDLSFLSGGDLPRCSEGLAAVLRMPRGVVQAAMTFCLGHEFGCAPADGCRHAACQVGGGLPATSLSPASGLGRGRVGGCLHPACQLTCLGHDPDCQSPRLIQSEGGRIFQKRVRHDVVGELEYRREQSDLGKLGGRPRAIDKGKGTVKGSEKGTLSEPKSPPAPSPAPSSAPTPFRTKDTPASAGGAAATGNGNGHPPTQPAFQSLDHDPDNPPEADLARACFDLARMYAASHGDEVTDDDCRNALEAATLTTEGKSMDTIRAAPSAWIRTSLRVAERMKREWQDDEGHDTRPKNQLGERPAPETLAREHRARFGDGEGTGGTG